MGSLIPLFLAACQWKNGSGVPGIPPVVLSACLAWSALIATSRLYKGVSERACSAITAARARHNRVY